MVPFLTENYGIKGTAHIDVVYAGLLNQGPGPGLTVKLDVLEGRMKERNTGAVFEKIRMNGEMSIDGNGDLNSFSVRDLHARAGNGSISGNLSFVGKNQALVKGSINSSIDLADLFHFARIDEEVSGYMALQANFNGSIDLTNGFDRKDLEDLAISGRSDLKNAFFQLHGMRHGIENLSATFILNGTDATVPELSATILNDAVSLEGSLKHLLPFLMFPNERLLIDARIHALHLDLEKAISTSNTASDQSSVRELTFPDNIDLSVNLDLKELDYATFKARDIVSRITISDQKLVAEPLDFETAGGHVSGALTLNTSGNGDYPLTVNADLSGIDVSELFVEFDEFGQGFIKHEHLKGTLNAKVRLSARLSRDMQLDKNALNSTIDLSISNGQLVQHAPMVEIADFVRKNKLYAAFIKADQLEEKLRHIRFEELTNTIRIADNKVIIPAMEVKSTAMNVNVSGVHTFNDHIDHHINFRLSELLTHKNRDSEFGEVIDDGTGLRIFLRMRGMSDNLVIENDKQALAEHRKANRESQKHELKELLKDEFGKGEKPPADEKSKIGPKFKVDWDDEEDSEPDTKKKKGFGKFLDKITQEEEKDVSFQVEP